ncbi:dihydroxy-acid dehydratase [Thalassospira sp.]|uniref:dihydroxy-acid dehydratase domain-containing protein n=1 Tax=Thalassospira sp. TaxID=1912094 RepID=UPI001B0FFABC|nr:dihydroxy-acid dehydratase [Thalassospira sp.]MBO6809183.1 dihydroxy-acid dehydratase [Thalassospira sp.]MBO6841142.1 dihydroxy-acid dehydratase [Thalassospira sp.]
MSSPANLPNTPIIIDEKANPYRDCIQGLANQPITVVRLLRDAVNENPVVGRDRGFVVPEIKDVVGRLVENRPRIAIIGGAPDHPAHLLDRPQALMAAIRIWEMGGVPFLFHVPVICDGTAQNNIGQSYSLASRNHTAAAVNITFEGHSYHAAYVIAGCDKSPAAVVAGLAAADHARAWRGDQAPVWAVFAPSHVLKGGEIPDGTRRLLDHIAADADAAGHDDLGADIRENMRYILQCTSDEAFAGLLERARLLGIIDAAQERKVLDELATATCDSKGGICAFNGTGNSSRTMLAAFGLTPPELELLTDVPPFEAVAAGVDALFGVFNKPEYAIGNLLKANFANFVRIHNATGSSSNMLLHLPFMMRYAGFDISIDDYQDVRTQTPVPEIFAHSLTENRDTFVLAQQMAEGKNRGMESIYRVLADLGVAMDLDAPTVLGKSWAERIADLENPVDLSLGDASVIRATPVRQRSGVDVLTGSFFENCAVKTSGMSDHLLSHFDDHVFIVRYYENEHVCNADFASPDLISRLIETDGVDEDLISAIVQRNGGNRVDMDAPKDMLEQGHLSFAFVIGGQGPEAYGMPEMFSPSQNLRHHRILEASSMLITDGRYSGVTKGACIGHMVPEAFTGGAVGYLKDGDVLRLDLTRLTLDWLEPEAFKKGQERASDPREIADRKPLFDERFKRMADRQCDIAASNVLDAIGNAARGIVPRAVDRRATKSWR